MPVPGRLHRVSELKEAVKDAARESQELKAEEAQIEVKEPKDVEEELVKEVDEPVKSQEKSVKFDQGPVKEVIEDPVKVEVNEEPAETKEKPVEEVEQEPVKEVNEGLVEVNEQQVKVKNEPAQVKHEPVQEVNLNFDLENHEIHEAPSETKNLVETKRPELVEQMPETARVWKTDTFEQDVDELKKLFLKTSAPPVDATATATAAATPSIKPAPAPIKSTPGTIKSTPATMKSAPATIKPTPATNVQPLAGTLVSRSEKPVVEPRIEEVTHATTKPVELSAPEAGAETCGT